MKNKRIYFPSILLFLLSQLNAYAVDSLSYSGRLVNSNGSPVVGPVNLKIEMAYTNAPSVTLCSQDFTNVPLSNGVFHLKLNFDCTPQTLQQVLSAIPANESAAVRVTDQTNAKAYAYQALHSVPFAYMSQTAMQLTSLGATNGQFLKWNNTTKKWEPGNAGAGNGSVTTINTGDGLTGGPISVSGTISIADGGVTDVKVATGIARTKLAAGTANHVVINNGTGDLSSVAQLPLAQGGTGAATAADARTNLGLGSASVANIGMGAGTVMTSSGVPECLPTEKLSMTLLPVNAWTCIADNDSADVTKLPLAGGQMTGDIDMNTNSITNLAAPTQLSDAATMGYVVNEIDALDTAKENKITSTTNLSVREVRFSELTVNGANYVSLRSPDALAADYTFILPGSYGTSGQVLSTNGAGGVLSWVDVATTATTVGGDVTGTISNIQLSSGVVGSTEVQDGSLSNVDIASGANIDAAKIGTGVVSNTEFNYLDGLTSSIQTQLNGKLSSTLPNCGAGQVLKSDGTSFSCVTDDTGPGAFSGTADRVVVTDGAGSLSVSSVTSTELGHLSGVTSAIQAQINAKQATLGTTSDLLGDQLRIYNGANYVELKSPALGGNVVLTLPTTDGDANQVLQTDGSGNLTWVDQSSFSIADGSVTYAKLNLADGDIPQAKVNGLVTALAGREPAIAAGTTAQYIRGDKTLSTFATDVINSVLTGFVTGANTTITASDTVLSAFEKIQGQVNAKLNTSSFVDWSVVGVQTLEPSRLNLGLSNRVMVTNGSGAAAVSSVTATELGYLSGVTSSIQTQLNAKLSSFTETDPSVSAFAKAALPTCGAGEVLKSNGTSFSCVTDNSGAGAFTGTANRVVLTDGAGDLAVSAVTNTEVGYLTGVTSAIQSQLNAKQGTLTSSTDLLGDQLRIYNGANYVEVRSPVLGGNVVLTLPNNDGSANEVLQTDGNGNLSWASFPSAPVTSVNTQTGAVTLSTTDVAEGTNQYFTGTRVLSTVLTGLSTATNAAIAATDSVLVAFGKLQAQISGQSTSISNKADQTNIAQTITAATVTGLTAPVAGSDAANKTYVDGQITGAANQWTAGSGNVYRTTGSVGIGTSTPAYMLDVNGAINATAISINGVAVGTGGTQWANGAAGAISYTGGNVGIGTASPVEKLNVTGTHIKPVIGGVTAHTPLYTTYDSQNITALEIAATGANPSLGVLALTSANTASGDFIGSLSFATRGTSGGDKRTGLISSSLDADSSSSVSGNLLFLTNNSGTVSEKMRITSSGRVGIGTTTPGSLLDVKGTLRLSGATSGYVGLAPAAAAGSTTYTLPSADGTNGQVLSTNGSGVMAWISPAGSVSSVFGRSGAVVATSGDYTATQVTNTAAGNIAATNVQTAINELDTEKQNVSTFAADVRSVVLTGLSTATNAAIAATDSILVSFGKLQAQISGQATSISGKADQTNIAQTITAATVTGLTAPISGSDAANKTYVDGQISSLSTVATGTEGQTLRNSAGAWVADSSFYNNGANATLAPAGAGTRMIWYPNKSAFRAGAVTGTQWDDANIGSFSIALGQNTRASAHSAVALGNGSVASGLMSVAMGVGNTASGQYSTATGSSTTASGESSATLGEGTTASGDYSVAMGNSNTASGYASIAMGSNTTADAYAQTTVGQYNLPTGTEDPASWVATDPLFVVANGTGGGASRSNALTVLKNGNTGVGVSNPFYKLEVNGVLKSTGAVYENTSASASGSFFNFWKHRNYGDTQLGDELGSFSFYGYKGSLLRGAYVIARQEAVNASGVPTALIFGTTPAGSSDSLERIRVSAAGYVGIANSSPESLLDIGTSGSTLGTLRLRGNTSGYVEISPSAAAGSWTMRLPGSAGGNGQVLQTDGSGNLSWVSPSAPAIADGSVTYAKLNLADGDIPQAKVNGLVAALAGKEPAITAGTTAQYIRGDKTLATFATDVRAAVLTGLSTATNAAIAATDSVLVAFGKLQAQITGQATSISGKADQTNIAQTITAATVTGLTAPIAGSDATNKTYVDAQVSGAANQWSVSSGNVYRSSGYVGVGTSAPATVLDTSGGMVRVRGGANFGVYPSSGQGLEMGYDSTAALGFISSYNRDTTAYKSMLIDSSSLWLNAYSGGNVGVGNAAPTALLHVGAGNNKFAFFNFNNPATFPTSGLGLTVGANYSGADGETNFWNSYETATTSFDFKQKTGASTASTLMTILANGKVGLGTSTPSRSLHIKDSARSPALAFEDGAATPNKWAIGSGISTISDGKFFIHDQGQTATRFAIDTLGNIGIGTTAPLYKLDINNGSGSSAIHISSNGADSGAYLLSHVPSGAILSGGASFNGTNWVAKDTSASSFAFGGGGIAFQADSGLTVGNTFTPTSRMTIAATGYVGVGTASPASPLHIGADSSTVPGIQIGSNSSVTNYLSLSGGRGMLGYDSNYLLLNAGASKGIAFLVNGTNGTIASGTPVINMTPAGLVGIGTNGPTGKLTVSVPTEGDVGLRLLSTSNVYLDIKPTNQSGQWQTVLDTVNNRNMIINTGTGFLGIGTITPDQKLVVSNGTTTGKYTTTGWTHSSDIRLKHDILPLENSLEKILKLRGVEFKFNSDDENRKQIGFIAQQVEPIFPETVITDNKGYKSMNYSNLVAPLTEAVKSLYKRIVGIEERERLQDRQIASKADKNELEELRSANKTKDQKIRELEERLARIEKAIRIK